MSGSLNVDVWYHLRYCSIYSLAFTCCTTGTWFLIACWPYLWAPSRCPTAEECLKCMSTSVQYEVRITSELWNWKKIQEWFYLFLLFNFSCDLLVLSVILKQFFITELFLKSFKEEAVTKKKPKKPKTLECSDYATVVESWTLCLRYELREEVMMSMEITIINIKSWELAVPCAWRILVITILEKRIRNNELQNKSLWLCSTKIILIKNT